MLNQHRRAQGHFEEGPAQPKLPHNSVNNLNWPFNDNSQRTHIQPIGQTGGQTLELSTASPAVAITSPIADGQLLFECIVQLPPEH